MAVTIIVGGQYGGEGKGAISAFLTSYRKYRIVIKTGGPNSSHTCGKNNHLQKYRMLPAGSYCGIGTVLFPAGSLIHVETLLNEVHEFAYHGEIIIDPNAGIIDDDIVDQQKSDDYYKKVGSTLTGTGFATSMRALRRLKLAKDEPKLSKYIRDSISVIDESIKREENILIEGCQSYGLSNYHGDYPYTTSRNTTAGEFLGQVGIGSNYVDEIILVIKCFPTRNRGGNGNLPNELSDEMIKECGDVLVEYGGGSYNCGDEKRRVGLFDFHIVKRAIIANTPHVIALTGLDKLENLVTFDVVRNHYGSPLKFIKVLEEEYNIPVAIRGWGPNIEDVRIIDYERFL